MNKVHFKEENEEGDNNIPMTKSPNPKKLKFKKKQIKEKKDEKKEPKEKREEEDWFKEIEELIEKENRRLSQKVQRKKLFKYNKTNNKNKKIGLNAKEGELGFDSEENKTKTFLSAKGSKYKLKKLII